MIDDSPEQKKVLWSAIGLFLCMFPVWIGTIFFRKWVWLNHLAFALVPMVLFSTVLFFYRVHQRDSKSWEERYSTKNWPPFPIDLPKRDPFILGPAGERCSHCSGSGREPEQPSAPIDAGKITDA